MEIHKHKTGCNQDTTTLEMFVESVVIGHGQVSPHRNEGNIETKWWRSGLGDVTYNRRSMVTSKQWHYFITSAPTARNH